MEAFEVLGIENNYMVSDGLLHRDRTVQHVFDLCFS